VPVKRTFPKHLVSGANLLEESGLKKILHCLKKGKKSYPPRQENLAN